MHMIVHKIAHPIAHTIMRTSMRTIACMERTNEVHMEHVRWMMDNGQTDKKWMTDRLFKKYDASVKKDRFPAEHIFFKVPHHLPIYVDFYRLNQSTAGCM